MTTDAEPKTITDAVIEPWTEQDQYLYGYTIVGRARILTNQGGVYQGLVVNRAHIKELRVVFWNKMNNTFASVALGPQNTVLGDASGKQTKRVPKLDETALLLELSPDKMEKLIGFFSEALGIVSEPGRQTIRLIIG